MTVFLSLSLFLTVVLLFNFFSFFRSFVFLRSSDRGDRGHSTGSSGAGGDVHGAWKLERTDIHVEVMHAFTELPRHPPPGGGVYVHDLHIEGAAWATKHESVSNKRGLIEAHAEAPRTAMPVMKIVGRDAVAVGVRAPLGREYVYDCPIYRFTGSRGTGELVTMIKLNTYRNTSDHWILRGVAIACSD